MQGKPAAGDDIRQRAMLIHEFVEVNIVVAYHKLNVHIGQLGLDIRCVAVVQGRAPHVDRDGIRVFLFRSLRTAARQKRQQHHRCYDRRHEFEPVSPFHLFLSPPEAFLWKSLFSHWNLNRMTMVT